MITVDHVDRSAIGSAELRALVGSHAGNLLYAAPEFLDFIETALPGASVSLLVAHKAGDIAGMFPIATMQATGVGSIVNSLPWYGSHGSVIVDRSAPDSDAIRQALLKAYRQHIDETTPLASTVILLPDEEPFRADYERIIEPSVIDDRIGQMTTLPNDGPDLSARLLGAFEQKTRNLVRKSLKQGFREDVSGDDRAWQFLWQTHSDNMAAIGGRAKPRAHFEALRRCIRPRDLRLSVAFDGETPVAAMLTITCNRTVEYITPVVVAEHRPRQPLSFLIHEGMLEAVRTGATHWNWGGTWRGQTALHHFKSGFGAQDRVYSYLVRATAEGLATLKERRSELAMLFPNFYAYPYEALQ